jgi:hypothetical protein
MSQTVTVADGNAANMDASYKECSVASRDLFSIRWGEVQFRACIGAEATRNLNETDLNEMRLEPHQLAPITSLRQQCAVGASSGF